MTGAVNVCVVTLVSLVLNVSGIDCNTTLSLLRSLIDHIVSLILSLTLQCQGLGDCSGKCGLTMVNVTDCADVNMGLGSFKFSLCHWNFLLVSSIGLCKSDNSILSDITGKCK